MLYIYYYRFEAGDITGIVELNALIKVNRYTHKLLSKHLALGSYNPTIYNLILLENR